MHKGLELWRRLSGIGKAFACSVLLYGILYLIGRASLFQSFAGLVSLILGLLLLFQLARRGMRQAIWRLRNRLITTYLFIAVVPIVLILTLVALAGWAVIGQMAIYLVNTELKHREESLHRQADALAHVPVGDPDRGIRRVERATHSLFPDFEMAIKGEQDLHYPAFSRLQSPPPTWGDGRELVLKREGTDERLFAWAHVRTPSEDVTIVAPVTHEFLANLVPGLGDVNFAPLMGYPRQSHIPDPVNALDFKIRGYYPVMVPRWSDPNNQQRLLLIVDTRISAVLGTLFQNQKVDWPELALGFFVVLSVMFLIIELASLVYGIRLSRTITGAVHELYEATQHVKEGDFSYRIPVKGSDQLAELSNSFNTMTANLGRLIGVAKEKERLESELAIAREVQNQLFPKDVPFTRSLELKGVCNPARMVSGDYYDFMSLSESSLAFAIGDVAGKGISAALLMATIQSTMRTQLATPNGAGPTQFSTAKLVSNLNRQLYATTAPEKYATFYFALYDDSNHQLTYTNAGHLAPILLRGNAISTLESTGTVVGAFPIARYGEKSVTLEKGDTLVAYTDGIVEPENAYGEMFGEERLQDLLVKYSKADSSEIIARTMEAVNQWTGSSELQDDMTMVVARRL
jgi:sigma-B regulation protein RsbU (phosphoserine phosphatase)